MKVRRRWHAWAAFTSAIAVLVALPLLPASAEESPSPATSAADKTVFTVGITQDVDSTNPFTGIAAASFEAYQMMYPTLTEYSAADFSTVPGLAESWEESADKTYWTYKIRPGLKWSDGEPLTARDAAYTFNRVINGDIEQTNYGGYTSTITKAVAEDDTTLVLYVKKPSPIMYQLAVYILPEHIWKDIDGKKVKSYKNEPENGEAVVGGGPYVLIERRKGEYLRFAANPNYYAGKPAAEKSSSGSTRTPTPSPKRCARARWTTPTTCPPTSSTLSRARRASPRCPACTPGSTRSRSTWVRP